MSARSDREKVIREKLLEEEALDRRDTDAVRGAMLRFLIEGKGYLAEEIEAGREFGVSIEGAEVSASLDFLVKVGGRGFMAVKCASSSIDSRQRHVVAIGRLIEPYIVPFCVVTDGTEARLIDTLNGKVISEDINSIPARGEALSLIEGLEPRKCPQERIEKEKRIVLAFESINCPSKEVL